MALVDVVADRLADQVGGDGEDAAGRVLSSRARLRRRSSRVVGLVDLEVVAPAGEFQAVVAEGLGLLAHGLDGQVGPLAGEQCYGSCHGIFFSSLWFAMTWWRTITGERRGIKWEVGLLFRSSRRRKKRRCPPPSRPRCEVKRSRAVRK